MFIVNATLINYQLLVENRRVLSVSCKCKAGVKQHDAWPVWCRGNWITVDSQMNRCFVGCLWLMPLCSLSYLQQWIVSLLYLQLSCYQRQHTNIYYVQTIKTYFYHPDNHLNVENMCLVN